MNELILNKTPDLKVVKRVYTSVHVHKINLRILSDLRFVYLSESICFIRLWFLLLMEVFLEG